MELSSQEQLCVTLPVPQPGVCRGYLNSWAFIWCGFGDHWEVLGRGNFGPASVAAARLCSEFSLPKDSRCPSCFCCCCNWDLWGQSGRWCCFLHLWVLTVEMSLSEPAAWSWWKSSNMQHFILLPLNTSLRMSQPFGNSWLSHLFAVLVAAKI